MKIAIVCGHFIPSLGYIEVYLAKEFSKLGHAVNVITSNQVPAYLSNAFNQKFTSGVETHPELDYTITRLKAKYSVGQMVVCKGVVESLDLFSPDLVVVIGLGKLFPKPILKKRNKSYQLITLLGDNIDNHEPSKRKLIIDSVKRSLKKPLYAKAVKYSNRIFSYTPETVPIVETIIPGKLIALLHKKNVNISLGFDIDKFFLSLEERKSGREKLGIPENDVVLITATRIIEHKRFENVINLVDEYNKSGQVLHYVIIGFFDDEYADQLKRFIESKEFSHRFHCFPFLTYEKVREFYQAADLAYFPSAVISIFEAMGTGLPVVLPSRTNVNHILDEGDTGWYFEKDQFKQALKLAYKKINETDKVDLKLKLSKKNQDKYSYAKITERILSNCSFD